MAVDRDFEHELHTGSAALAGTLFETRASRIQNRVDEIMAGRNCDTPPTGDQIALVRELRSRVGEHRAIDIGTLAARLRCNEREVRDLVSQLRRGYGLQIGAPHKGQLGGGGFYLIETDEEMEATIGPMRANAVNTLRTVLAMCGPDKRAKMLSDVYLAIKTEVK